MKLRPTDRAAADVGRGARRRRHPARLHADVPRGELRDATPSASAYDAVSDDVLLVPERPKASIRRRPRSKGGQLRTRPRCVRALEGRPGGCSADVSDPAAELPGLPAVLPVHRKPRRHMEWSRFVKGPRAGEGERHGGRASRVLGAAKVPGADSFERVVRRDVHTTRLPRVVQAVPDFQTYYDALGRVGPESSPEAGSERLGGRLPVARDLPRRADLPRSRRRVRTCRASAHRPSTAPLLTHRGFRRVTRMRREPSGRTSTAWRRTAPPGCRPTIRGTSTSSRSASVTSSITRCSGPARPALGQIGRSSRPTRSGSAAGHGSRCLYLRPSTRFTLLPRASLLPGLGL